MVLIVDDIALGVVLAQQAAAASAAAASATTATVATGAAVAEGAAVGAGVAEGAAAGAGAVEAGAGLEAGAALGGEVAGTAEATTGAVGTGTPGDLSQRFAQHTLDNMSQGQEIGQALGPGGVPNAPGQPPAIAQPGPEGFSQAQPPGAQPQGSITDVFNVPGDKGRSTALQGAGRLAGSLQQPPQPGQPQAAPAPAPSPQRQAAPQAVRPAPVAAPLQLAPGLSGPTGVQGVQPQASLVQILSQNPELMRLLNQP